MKKIKNIYIIGIIRGSNRTQHLIKYLLDQRQNVFLDTQTLFVKKPGNKLIERFLIFMGARLTKLAKIYKIWACDIVVLPAMGNMRQDELHWAKKFKKKIYTDFYISLYDSEIKDRQIDTYDSKKAQDLKKIDRNCIEYADKVFFLNSTEARYYLETLGLTFNNEKHLILPLCVEEKFKCNLNYFFKTNENSIFNICWWGTYIPLHGLEKILKAAKILDNEYKLQFHLYLFGTDDEKAKPYKELIEKMNLENKVTIDNTKTFSNGKLGHFLKNNCDLVLGNFGDSDKAKNVIVNKLIDGIAMKAPVLTGESVAPKEYFGEDAVFYCSNSSEKMAEIIQFISTQSSSQMDFRINKAYQIYESNFSVTAYYKRLNKIFDL